jgi:hypothetical protein
MKARRQEHYLLMKNEGVAADGTVIGADEAMNRLLDAKIWPLTVKPGDSWTVVKAGDQVAVYQPGTGRNRVVAQADVVAVHPWTPILAARYPLAIECPPTVALQLGNIRRFTKPVNVRDLLHRLSFVSTHAASSNAWSASFAGGMRRLKSADFALLTRA